MSPVDNLALIVDLDLATRLRLDFGRELGVRLFLLGWPLRSESDPGRIGRGGGNGGSVDSLGRIEVVFQE